MYIFLQSSETGLELITGMKWTVFLDKNDQLLNIPGELKWHLTHNGTHIQNTFNV